MTISTTSSQNKYSGNGTTTVFAYSFPITDDDEITVVVTEDADTDEEEFSLTKTTHFTVSNVGNSSGGNITIGDITTKTTNEN